MDNVLNLMFVVFRDSGYKFIRGKLMQVSSDDDIKDFYAEARKIGGFVFEYPPEFSEFIGGLDCV